MRLKFLAFAFLFAFLLITVRLFYWQIIKGNDLAASAKSQYKDQTFVPGARGNILAKDLSWLARSTDAWTVFVSLPDFVSNPKKSAEAIAPYFVEDPEDRSELLIEIDRLETVFSRKDAVWVPLENKVSTSIKENIEKLEIEGIGFEKTESRVYPEASNSAHILGFVGKNEANEDTGYFGLEGHYNVTLTGNKGYRVSEKDARGLPLLMDSMREVGAGQGVDLITHIEKPIQLAVETKLKEGIEKYGASAGSVIVMNPKTGAIMAMASYPSFDPAKYWKFGDEFFANPTISSTFEPGSVFKVLVMASGLDSGVVKPDTVCDICSGPLKVDKYSIETWDNKYRPDSVMTDVIVHSDNVGMAYVGQKLGADKLYDYLSKFRIGEKTGIDLQGEVSVSLREKGTWNIVDLATASFGQGVAVTPIEIIRATAAIANEGKLVTPQVVDKLVHEGWEEDIKPDVGERVISKEAAADITAMMVEAAKNGESKWTHIKGFSVAGKTGTAQIPIAGHYDAEKTIASFIGFSPAYDPKFIMLITLKEPTTSPWASETAAPMWYSIANQLFPYFGIQPEN